MASAELPARSLAAVLAALLAGCSAGPDFRSPAAPATDGYTASPLAMQTVSTATAHGDAQRFVTDAGVGGAWWHALGSPRLDALIVQALRASPTVAAAGATLRQAQENRAAQAGSTRYPQVDAALAGQRQRLNPAALGQAGDTREFGVYNASVGVHYQLDLAGGDRRALEALTARADYQRQQLAGAQLTLAANVVSTAIAQAQLAAQLEATEAMLQAQEEQLALTRARVRLGTAAPDEASSLQTQVERTRASVPQLRQQLQQHDHLLAVLAGRAPGAGDLPSFRLAEFRLPTQLPVLLPSELVRRRPDIQAAEALLHEANADYGVTIAKLYPQLDLSANLGSQALSTGALFGNGSAAWALLAQLTQPLFDASLPAKKRAALAALDAAAANYQGVVLEALRSVADVLRALENDARILSAQAAAEAAAQASLTAASHRQALGAASDTELLIAQQQLQQTRIALLAAQAQRLTDSVALYQAMGGGNEAAAAVRLADAAEQPPGNDDH
jgi:NodT family efflux transporter outer membrane factor (OMF) lipoprotein